MTNNTFFIAGKHSVEETLKYNQNSINFIVCSKNKKAEIDIFLKQNKLKIEVFVWPDSKINKLFDSNFKTQGIAANIKKNNLKSLSSLPITENNILIFEELYDYRNIGSIIRTALAFDIKSFFFNKKNHNLNNEYIYQTSSGYINLIDCYEYSNLANFLTLMKKKGFWISGLDSNSQESIYNFAWPRKNLIVIGNEHTGLKHLTKQRCDYLLNIPINPKVESLNVSNALAVTLAVKKKAPVK